MEMLELLDNIFQMLMFLIIIVISVKHTIKKPEFLPLQYFAGAVTCCLSGTIFWTLYFYIQGEFPYYLSAADLCYVAWFVFLTGLCRFTYKRDYKAEVQGKYKWLPILFAVYVGVMNTLCYLLVGGLFWMLLYAVPLAILAYMTGLNVVRLRGNQEYRALYLFYLALSCYIIVCNLMYLVSSMGWNNVYLLGDFCATWSVAFMLLFLLKEEHK